MTDTNKSAADVDIFAEGHTMSGRWASWKEIGDSIQGTYTGRRQAKDGYGNDQIVYELLDRKTGEVINVGFRLTKKPIHNSMASVKFGQIVGFKYVANKQVKNPITGTIGTTKVIDVFSDHRFWDTEWIEAQKMGAIPGQNATQFPPESLMGSEEDGDLEVSMDEVNKAFEDIGKPTLTEEEKLAKIVSIGKEKLGGATDQDAKDKVIEATNLPLLKTNYDEILNRLSLV